MKNKETIEQAAGGVTLHVMLPEHLVKFAVARAKEQGHNDISVVAREAIQRLIDRHEAGLPLT